MAIVKHSFLLFLTYAYISLTNSEIFPFFIHADQVFLKCPDGKLESFNRTTHIPSICVQTTQPERFNLFQLYIQCPDERLYLEYDRTFTFNAQVSEYSMASLQPHCFVENMNQHLNKNQLVPYQTRYTSENDTFTQIISFQCQHNLTMVTNENSKLDEQFYLFFKLMNYGLCRYLIQFMNANGQCNRFQQQAYKIQAEIKNSVCYFQLGHHSSEIPLGYFDHLIHTNHSLSKYSLYATPFMNRTIIVMTASIATIALLLWFVIFITMYRCGLFQS